MQNKNDIKLYHYNNEEVEKLKLLLKNKLTTYVGTQAPHDGQRSDLITESEFKILVLDFLTSETQLTVDEIKKFLEVPGHIFNAKEAEEIAETEKVKLAKQINLNAHEKNDLIAEKYNLPTQNNWKNKIGKWLLPLAIAFTGIDSIISYQTFRIAYPTLIAVVMAIAAGAVVLSSHWLAHWIGRIKDGMRRRKYTLLILGGVLLFFTAIALIRVQALNSQVSINVSDNATVPRASTLPFVIISFGLFAVSFVLTLFSLKSLQECAIEQKHKELDKEIKELEQVQTRLQKELKELPEKVAKQKAQARIIFYYLQASIKECKSIAQSALVQYKKIFTQVRGMVPSFFERYNDIEIDETFLHHKNIEQ